MKRIVLVALVCAMLLTAVSVYAAPKFSSSLQSVTVNGSKIAGGGCASLLYDAGTYHMWYRTGQGTIDGLRHATSTDGLAFTDTGSISFASNPFAAGTTAPYLYYENVSKVGNDYKLLHWTYTGGAGNYPSYDYNISVSSLGSDPNNTVATHEGSISGAAGAFAGAFGIIDGNLYSQGGSTGRDLMRSVYTDTPSPSIGTASSVLNTDALFNGLGFGTGYINNHSDVVSMGSELGFFFTLRADFNGYRANKQVYFASSADGGASWTSPVALLSSPTLDGVAPAGNFAHAEAVYNGTSTYLYVSTMDAAGNYVIARAGAVPEPTSIMVLLMGLGGLVGIKRLRR